MQFVSPMFVSRIEGLCDNESSEILTDLHEHCAEERFLYTHEWQLGEIVIWCVQCSAAVAVAVAIAIAIAIVRSLLQLTVAFSALGHPSS
jgi:hypothetical protein